MLIRENCIWLPNDEKFAPKKKQKTLVLTNVEKRAVGKGVGGGGITYPPDLWIWTIQNQKIKN